MDRGSDERQFNSPKVDFPIATVFRSKFGNFKQYHTSLDNFDIVTNEIIESSFKLMMKTIEIFQKQIIPIAAHHCEPNMGKRGLYSLISEKNTKKKFNNTKNLMNFLQYSDGKNDINDIAKIIKLTPKEVMKNYTLLKTKKLFEI